MKTFRTQIVALAALTAVIVSVPALASHPSASPFYGTPIHGDVAGPDRSIGVDAGTRWVNVTGGETIEFKVGGESFTWRFDTFSNSPVFDLREIAPAGALNRSITVYVSPNPADIS